MLQNKLAAVKGQLLEMMFHQYLDMNTDVQGNKSIVDYSNFFEEIQSTINEIRGIKDLIVIKLKASKLDKTKLYESFDHDYSFFKCRAYVYEKDIPLKDININDIRKYNLK